MLEDLKAVRIFHGITRLARSVAMALMTVMMLFVAFDVMGRYFFNKPLKGSSDFVELMLGVVVFFSMAYCTQKSGDARVDLLYSRLTVKLKAALDSITFSAALFLYLLIAWRLAARAWGYLREPMTSPVTDLLGIPYWPFLFLAAIGSALLCLELILKIFGFLGSLKTVD